MTQWLRIRLPMQGTQVRALVQEDPTCHGATKPVGHTTEAHMPRAPCSATREATAMPVHCMKSSPHSPQLEKTHVQQRRPKAAKNK